MALPIPYYANLPVREEASIDKHRPKRQGAPVREAVDPQDASSPAVPTLHRAARFDRPTFCWKAAAAGAANAAQNM